MINKTNSTLSILLALIILGLLSSQLPKLEFDYDFEKFFPNDDPDLSYYQEFSKIFGYDNDYLLLGFESPEGIFRSNFLTSINERLKLVANLEYTQKVVSPTSLKTIISTPLGKLPVPLLHISDSLRLKSDSIKLKRHPLYSEMFISKSGKTIKAVVVHERFINKEQADSYVGEIKNLFKDQTPRVRIVGKAIAQTTFVNAIREDFGRFIAIALVLIFLLLVLYMRNLLLIITALTVAGLAVVGTMGMMAFAGKKIDVLSSLIPTILLVVAMSDIIHLFAHIQKIRQSSGSLQTAISLSVRQIGMATLLTSLTTAMGFLTLVSINVNPVIDLGIYAALGILFALLITYLLFPAIVNLIRPSFPPLRPNLYLRKMLHYTLGIIFKKGRIITTSAIVLFVLGVFGLSQLEIDAYLVHDLPNNNSVKEDFQYFDQEFAGSKPFTLSLKLKDEAQQVYSPKVIEQLDQVEQLVRKEMGVAQLISPVTMVKIANQSLHRGSVDYYTLPETDKEWRKVLKWITKLQPERRFGKLTEEGQIQMVGYLQDLGSKDAFAKQSSLSEKLPQIIGTETFDYRVTGTSLLVDKSHELLSTHLLRGLLVATLFISFISGALFKSWRMIVITLIPNLFPILLLAAIMGYLQIPVSLSTSVIFAISFGIVVDDTIHFLSHFRQEHLKGRSKTYAVKSAVLVTGNPIWITTVVLTCGFLVFCFSNFNASFYMGLFVSVSFIAALLADLFLLPLLILFWFKDSNHSK